MPDVFPSVIKTDFYTHYEHVPVLDISRSDKFIQFVYSDLGQSKIWQKVY